MFRSLSFRMITIFICLTVLVVLITSIVFMFLFQKFAITDQQTTITKCAQEIAQIVSKDEASAYDYRKSTINDYNSFTESILDSKLWIVMTDGMFRRIGTSSKSPYHIKELTEKEASNIYRSFDGKTIYTTDFKESFGEDTMTVLVPIMSTVLDDTSIPQVIGTVLVHCPMTKINESFTTAQTFLIVAIVFAVFIAMAVAIALSMRFTKPLKQMCSAAAQIAEGNYSVRTHIYDRSELSELSMSLNHLAKTLSRTISALQSETEKLNNIIDNISDGLASYDMEGHLVKYNTALIKMCSYEKMRDPQILNALNSILKGQSENQVAVIEDDDILKFTFTAIKDDGELLGAVMIVQDISRNERLERTRREFVSNVSHEFRTPLTVIKGSVELLIDGALTDPDAVMQTYMRIERETTALETLVKDLLDVSRLKSGKISLNLKDVNISELISDTIHSMKMISVKKNIEIKYAKNRMPLIRGDYDRLRQLLIIFIDNAIKFTPQNGVISIATTVVDSMACIKIRDTGKGIAKEDIPFIFERFYKADKSRGGSSKGTGLGLSIANTIAELHGGGITVESEIGKGTEFSIMLPLAENSKD